MKRILTTTAAALIASATAADVTIEHHGADAAPFATVTLQNRTETRMIDEPRAFDTPHGRVVLRYQITRNSDPDPRDVLTVIDLPSDVIAHPGEIRVPELSAGSIELFLWRGM